MFKKMYVFCMCVCVCSDTVDTVCGAAETVLVHQNNTPDTPITLSSFGSSNVVTNLPIFGNKRTTIFSQSCFISVLLSGEKKSRKSYPFNTMSDFREVCSCKLFQSLNIVI